MNILDIKDIPQVKSNQTIRELNIACAYKWLKEGWVKDSGGGILADWLDKNQDSVEDVFCCLNRIYLQCKDQLANRDVATLIIENNIGDEVRWIQHKDSDRWKLMVWWEKGKK